MYKVDGIAEKHYDVRKQMVKKNKMKIVGYKLIYIFELLLIMF